MVLVVSRDALRNGYPSVQHNKYNDMDSQHSHLMLSLSNATSTPSYFGATMIIHAAVNHIGWDTAGGSLINVTSHHEG